MVVTKFESLKLTYLISNFRKEMYINKNECKIKIKCILLVVTKFESLKLIYLIANCRKEIYSSRNEYKIQMSVKSK